MTREWTDASRASTRVSEERSVGDLISEVAEDFQRLVRQQVELAKAELKEQATRAAQAGAMMAAAAVAGLMVVVLFSFAAAFGLAEVLPLGWATLIVGGIWVVIGAVAFVMGRQRLRRMSPVPQKTVDTLKEDMRWLRNPTG